MMPPEATLPVDDLTAPLLRHEVSTTIGERWDSMLPDGTINPGEMTSVNHYALGAVVAEGAHR